MTVSEQRTRNLNSAKAPWKREQSGTMAGPMGMEYGLDLQKQPGAWSHVLTTEVEGPGDRPFGLAILC